MKLTEQTQPVRYCTQVPSIQPNESNGICTAALRVQHSIARAVPYKIATQRKSYKDALAFVSFSLLLPQ